MLLPFYLCNISDQNIFHICGCRIQLHHQALEKLYKTELARKSQKWSKQCLPFGASQGSSPIGFFWNICLPLLWYQFSELPWYWRMGSLGLWPGPPMTICSLYFLWCCGWCPENGYRISAWFPQCFDLCQTHWLDLLAWWNNPQCCWVLLHLGL